jgi:hypothetical protein
LRLVESVAADSGRLWPRELDIRLNFQRTSFPNEDSLEFSGSERSTNLAHRTNRHSMISAFGIIAEIYQTIPVIDLDVQKVKHRETEDAGSFRTNSFAYIG